MQTIIIGKLYQAVRDIKFIDQINLYANIDKGDLLLPISIVPDVWNYKMTFLNKNGEVKNGIFHISELAEWFERVV